MSFKERFSQNKIQYILAVVLLVVSGCFTFFYVNKVKSVVYAPSENNSDYYQQFVVYGDTRTNNKMHQKIVNEILKSSANPVFHVGDLVEDGDDPQEWATFNQITSKLRDQKDFYSVAGNHEKNSDLYFDNFSFPGNEHYYSVDLQNLKMIVLDSNIDTSYNSEQYKWLESELKKSENENKFVTTLLHHPPYSTGKSKQDSKGLQKTFVPLFEKYGVNAVFCGDEHDYERLSVNGVSYFVVGGGGAPLIKQSRTAPYSKIFLSSYNYSIVSVNNENLVVTVYNQDSEKIDQVIIKKD